MYHSREKISRLPRHEHLPGTTVKSTERSASQSACRALDELSLLLSLLLSLSLRLSVCLSPSLPASQRHHMHASDKQYNIHKTSTIADLEPGVISRSNKMSKLPQGEGATYRTSVIPRATCLRFVRAPFVLTPKKIISKSPCLRHTSKTKITRKCANDLLRYQEEAALVIQVLSPTIVHVFGDKPYIHAISYSIQSSFFAVSREL